MSDHSSSCLRCGYVQSEGRGVLVARASVSRHGTRKGGCKVSQDVAISLAEDILLLLHHFRVTSPAINMIYDKKSFDTMRYIENALQSPITGIKTDDFEQMEKVSGTFSEAPTVSFSSV